MKDFLLHNSKLDVQVDIITSKTSKHAETIQSFQTKSSHAVHILCVTKGGMMCGVCDVGSLFICLICVSLAALGRGFHAGKKYLCIEIKTLVNKGGMANFFNCNLSSKMTSDSCSTPRYRCLLRTTSRRLAVLGVAKAMQLHSVFCFSANRIVLQPQISPININRQKS